MDAERLIEGMWFEDDAVVIRLRDGVQVWEQWLYARETVGAEDQGRRAWRTDSRLEDYIGAGFVAVRPKHLETLAEDDVSLEVETTRGVLVVTSYRSPAGA